MTLFALDTSDTLTLGDLLAIEDDEAVVGVVCPETGIPLWSQVRIAFFRTIMGDLLYQGEIPGRADQGVGRLRATVTLARFAISNARLLLTGGTRAPILIKGDAVTDQLSDGFWRNPLADGFAEASPGAALTLFDHYAWRWPLPRRSRRPLFLAPLQVRHAAFGALAVGANHREAAGRLIQLVCERAYRSLGWEIGPERRTVLTEFAARKAAALPRKARDYRRLLDQIRPRLLLLTEGCYGAHAAMIVAARARGILTAEFQHGMVTAGHDAYNFADAVRGNTAFGDTLPEIFLSHGAWWEEQMNAPVEKVTIGNPARRPPAEPAGSKSERTDILILSDGIDFPQYLELASRVAAGPVPIGRRVVLRPHPIEREKVGRAMGGRSGDVHIVAEGSIYDALGKARLVISEVSTGLFEAYGIVDHVWALGTAKTRFSLPRHPFESIASADALDRKLKALDAAAKPRQPTVSLWASDWQANYARFLRERGVLTR